MPCRVVKEANGSEWWRVASERGVRLTRGKKVVKTLRDYDEIAVQWSFVGRGDTLWIRQGEEHIELSMGQTYDLIDALNRAVGREKWPPQVKGYAIA